MPRKNSSRGADEGVAGLALVAAGFGVNVGGVGVAAGFGENGGGGQWVEVERETRSP